MFKIGDFSRLTPVTVQALRHYEQLGLLEPGHTDPFTGYRYDSSAQLPRLNRILALEDLGFSLEQIGQLLDAELAPDQLRAVLQLKAAEVRDQIAEAQARLARLDARQRQLEQGADLPAVDVVVKRVGPLRVAAVRDVLPHRGALGALFGELAAYRQRHGLTVTGSAVIWHDPDFRETGVDAEAVLITEDPVRPEGRVRGRQLPAEAAMACVVHQGDPATIGLTCQALAAWIEASGYQITGPERLGATLAAMAQAAEAAGFDAIAVADHVWQHPILGGAEGPSLECYTTLAFLAAQTRRVKLMTLATPVSYRHPGMLAKTVPTLDVLSGGRAWLGSGTGDDEEEARGLDLPFPPLRERYAMLEETLQICLRMWSGEVGDRQPYHGQHYQLDRLLNLPQSLARPHPPILIAGDGERKTLRLVARYADACSLRPTPELPHKLEVLRRHCEAEGRDYDAIAKTCAFLFDVGEDGATAGELIERLRWLAGMGIETVMGWVAHGDRITPIEVVGREVIPAVADL
ncbi:MAG: TIGR03560 family F420-dependent LLM class oxidoreductase [Sphaerobacter sp.]|nr:TIGR03560 family F420-dependent LLM class oxidoreductase [Sphaerobacter sp.]